jgi:UDP-N-acetyl-2-amino-2-deoxyglucuronate dehydrogenase
VARKPLGLGLVSCGEIAVAHQKAIATLNCAKIVACMDVKRAAAKDMGGRCDCPHFTDYDKLLALDEVEAVLISSPHFLHAPQAIAAAKAGKHVMVEKPIATTEKDATAMIAACKRAGVKLATIFPMRYGPEAIKARQLIRSGAIGKLSVVDCFTLGHKQASYWTGGFSGRVKTNWRQKKATAGGGFLIMNFVHNIDLMRFVTGLEADTVYADYDTFATPVEVEDAIAVTIRYEGGALGSIFGTTFAHGRGPNGNHIIGTKGHIVLGDPLRVYLTRPFKGMKAGEWIEIDCGSVDARAMLVERFVKAVRANRTPDITGEDGRAALRTILAAYQSGQKKRPVKVKR